MAFFSRKNKNQDKPAPAAATGQPMPNVLIDILLAQSDILGAEIDSEIRAANRRAMEEITSGALTGLPAQFTKWFATNQSAIASPTELGYTWYAHQDTGRMQLVLTELLALTELTDPANQPGTQLWGSRVVGPDFSSLTEPSTATATATHGIPPKPPEPSQTAESVERRARSIARLRAEGVRVYEDLPVIESEADTTRRTAQEIADRAMALCLVSFKGDGIQQGVGEEQIASTMQALREGLAVEAALSPDERAFLDATGSDGAQQFTWRYESLWVLLWALGYIESLDPPTSMCDVDRTSTEILDRGPAAFVSEANLRTQHEILDEADLIYRYNWACVDARVNGHPIGGLNPGVVVERHWALNWLIGYMGQSWDFISTDT